MARYTRAATDDVLSREAPEVTRSGRALSLSRLGGDTFTRRHELGAIGAVAGIGVIVSACMWALVPPRFGTDSTAPPGTARALLESTEFLEAATDQLMALGDGNLIPLDRNAVRASTAYRFAARARYLSEARVSEDQQAGIMHMVKYVSDPRVQSLGVKVSQALHSAANATPVHSGPDATRRYLVRELLPHLDEIRELREEVVPLSLRGPQERIFPAMFRALDGNFCEHAQLAGLLACQKGGESNASATRRLRSAEGERRLLDIGVFEKFVDMVDRTGDKPLKAFQLETHNVGKIMNCVKSGKAAGQCGEHAAMAAFAALGEQLSEGHVAGFGKTMTTDANELRASDVIAKPLYSVDLAKCFNSICQAAQCGPQAFVRKWQSPLCKKVGFGVANDTIRFVRREELGTENATFILAAQLDGVYPNFQPRPAESLKHKGELCWDHCGQQGGYCAWCGVGNACCGVVDPSDPIECQGVQDFAGKTYHTCVAPVPDPPRSVAILNAGMDCYGQCGNVGGYCNVCGAGNMCCKKGAVEDPRECDTAETFLTSGYECVTPTKPIDVPPPGPTTFGCLIAMRGSMNSQNGILNLDFATEPTHFPEECVGCRVHSGFHSTWLAVQENVIGALNDLNCKPGNPHSAVVFTGESFGAGVAAIGMFYLQAKGYNVLLSYSFASPRIGNAKWAETYNLWFGRPVPGFRITHGHDVVSRLPPRSFMGYTHVNSEVYYPGEDINDYTVCFDGEAPNCGSRYNMADCLGKDFLDKDHCKSGLAYTDRDIYVGDSCQCTMSDWYQWYNASILHPDPNSSYYKPMKPTAPPSPMITNIDLSHPLAKLAPKVWH